MSAADEGVFPFSFGFTFKYSCYLSCQPAYFLYKISGRNCQKAEQMLTMDLSQHHPAHELAASFFYQ